MTAAANALLRRLLRAGAVVIALAAVVDPAFVRQSTDRPTIALAVAPGNLDAGRIADLRRAFAAEFNLVDAPAGAADATLVAGNALPEGWEELGTPAFAVRRTMRAAVATLERATAPARLRAGSLATVAADIRVRGARGQPLGASLRAGGVLVDSVTRRIATDDTVLSIAFALPVVTPGPTALRIEAGFAGAAPSDSAIGDLLVDATERPWSVLVADSRASWGSTFVRRALERDERFAVASAIALSRGVASHTGNAGSPGAAAQGITAGARLESFDLVVVGGADALSASEVTALDAYLRRRGGTVVLILDAVEAGPWQRLTGVGNWRRRESGVAVAIAPAGRDSAGLRAAEIAWPAAMPAATNVIAFAGTTARDSARAPVVWSTPVGAGRLIVSGALDAWRYRDANESGFTAFWRELLANAAASAPARLTLNGSASVVEPGSRVQLAVTLRDIAIASPASARASLSASLGDVPLDFAPRAAPGTLQAEFSAPGDSGLHTVAVASGADSATLPILVRARARRPTGPRAALDAWIAASGGRAFDDDQLGDLTRALKEAIRPAARAVPWHPMRSPWWILPFALLLSGEWWLRRRGGFR